MWIEFEPDMNLELDSNKNLDQVWVFMAWSVIARSPKKLVLLSSKPEVRSQTQARMKYIKLVMKFK